MTTSVDAKVRIKMTDPRVSRMALNLSKKWLNKPGFEMREILKGDLPGELRKLLFGYVAQLFKELAFEVVNFTANGGAMSEEKWEEFRSQGAHWFPALRTCWDAWQLLAKKLRVFGTARSRILRDKDRSLARKVAEGLVAARFSLTQGGSSTGLMDLYAQCWREIRDLLLESGDLSADEVRVLGVRLGFTADWPEDRGSGNDSLSPSLFSFLMREQFLNLLPACATLAGLPGLGTIFEAIAKLAMLEHNDTAFMESLILATEHGDTSRNIFLGLQMLLSDMQEEGLLSNRVFNACHFVDMRNEDKAAQEIVRLVTDADAHYQATSAPPSTDEQVLQLALKLQEEWLETSGFCFGEVLEDSHPSLLWELQYIYSWQICLECAAEIRTENPVGDVSAETVTRYRTKAARWFRGLVKVFNKASKLKILRLFVAKEMKALTSQDMAFVDRLAKESVRNGYSLAIEEHESSAASWIASRWRHYRQQLGRTDVRVVGVRLATNGKTGRSAADDLSPPLATLAQAHEFHNLLPAVANIVLRADMRALYALFSNLQARQLSHVVVTNHNETDPWKEPTFFVGTKCCRRRRQRRRNAQIFYRGLEALHEDMIAAGSVDAHEVEGWLFVRSQRGTRQAERVLKLLRAKQSDRQKLMASRNLQAASTEMEYRP
jgi:hypothetical protein